MPHLVVDISGHGFGHAGQVLPVVSELMAARPDIQVTIRTAVPAETVHGFMQRDLLVKPPPADVGLVMHGPIEVDVPASAAGYARLHADFDTVVCGEAERLAALKPDLLLADVPYTSLAAAAGAGVPAVALCSLNWLDAYRAYCADRPEAARVMTEIRRAYAAAELFLQPRPHTAMAELDNTRSIPPVCRVGQNRRAGLAAALGLDPKLSLVLLAFGGVPGTPWPDPPRVPGHSSAKRVPTAGRARQPRHRGDPSRRQACRRPSAQRRHRPSLQ